MGAGKGGGGGYVQQDSQQALWPWSIYSQVWLQTPFSGFEAVVKECLFKGRAVAELKTGEGLGLAEEMLHARRWGQGRGGGGVCSTGQPASFVTMVYTFPSLAVDSLLWI